MRLAAALLAAALLAAASSLAAASPRVQSPDAPWQTIATEHYRIHYPAHPSGGFAAFAAEVASQVEPVHAALSEWVGFAAKGPVHVVVRDPVGEANGLALPLLEGPVVELWRTPPRSDSSIAAGASWIAVLVAHELAHVHHLARPQLEPRLAERLVRLPVGPLALKTPRWAIEGYATLLEGRLSGSGRPYRPYRAAVLRQWAIEGKLPSYGALSGAGGFRGGSMAYLAGSAYLEWLERRSEAGPDALRALWRRLVSPRRPSFVSAFEATFGVSPRDGYDRFRAEVTRDALEAERRLAADGLCEGEPWARTAGEVTDLAVSPDGGRLLARVLAPRGAGLRIYSLGKDAQRREAAAAARRRGRPGEDEDIPPAFPGRRAELTLSRVNGAVAESPAFCDGGRVCLLLAEPDAEGVLVRRPHVWTPGRGLERDRRGARDRGPRVEDVGGRPVAVLGPERVVLPFEPVGAVALDGSARYLYGAADVSGIWNLVRVALRHEGGTLAAGPVEVLTRTTSAAWNPAPTPDGSALFFTRLSAAGVEIRRLDLSGNAPLAAAAPAEVPDPFVPGSVLPPPPGAPLLPPPLPPPAPTPYRPSDSTRLSVRSGASVSPAGTALQAGVGASDLLGRLSWQLLAGFGDAAGPRGMRAEGVYRGLRWAPSAVVFHALERPSAQRFVPAAGLDRSRTGAEAAFSYRDLSPLGVALAPALAWERVVPAEGEGPRHDRVVAGLEAALSRRFLRGERWGLALAARATLQAGLTGGDAWQLLRGEARLGVRTPAGWVSGAVEAGSVSGAPGSGDGFRLGGPESPLVARSLDAGRVVQPALPVSAASGDRLLRLRATLGRALRLSLEHTAVWDASVVRPAFTRVASLELAVNELVEEPLLVPLLGRLSLVAGVHRPLDGGMAGRTVATLLFSTRP